MFLSLFSKVPSFTHSHCCSSVGFSAYLLDARVAPLLSSCFAFHVFYTSWSHSYFPLLNPNLYRKLYLHKAPHAALHFFPVYFVSFLCTHISFSMTLSDFILSLGDSIPSKLIFFHLFIIIVMIIITIVITLGFGLVTVSGWPGTGGGGQGGFWAAVSRWRVAVGGGELTLRKLFGM